MKSFEENLASRFSRLGKRALTKPVRHFLLRVPLLPPTVGRFLDDIRFVEPDVLRFVRNTVRPGWCCVDAGAHCGTVSLRLAMLVTATGRVVAIEPVTGNADTLEHNIKQRGYSPRCDVIRSAVGSEEGRMTMVRGDHSTTWKLATDQRADGTVERVGVRTLDHILEACPNPDFIKVDIEGAEQSLVVGAPKTIQVSRPIWLFEMHSPESWSLAHEFFRSDYRAFDLQGKEIAPPLASSLAYGHVVFCPREKIALLG